MDEDSIGEYAAAIRCALYRAQPDMPNYPVGIVEPVIQPLFDRIEALETALQEIARQGVDMHADFSRSAMQSQIARKALARCEGA